MTRAATLFEPLVESIVAGIPANCKPIEGTPPDSDGHSSLLLRLPQPGFRTAVSLPQPGFQVHLLHTALSDVLPIQHAGSEESPPGGEGTTPPPLCCAPLSGLLLLLLAVLDDGGRTTVPPSCSRPSILLFAVLAASLANPAGCTTPPPPLFPWIRHYGSNLGGVVAVGPVLISDPIEVWSNTSLSDTGTAIVLDTPTSAVLRASGAAVQDDVLPTVPGLLRSVILRDLSRRRDYGWNPVAFGSGNPCSAPLLGGSG